MIGSRLYLARGLKLWLVFWKPRRNFTGQVYLAAKNQSNILARFKSNIVMGFLKTPSQFLFYKGGGMICVFIFEPVEVDWSFQTLVFFWWGFQKPRHNLHIESQLLKVIDPMMVSIKLISTIFNHIPKALHPCQGTLMLTFRLCWRVQILDLTGREFRSFWRPAKSSSIPAGSYDDLIKSTESKQNRCFGFNFVAGAGQELARLLGSKPRRFKECYGT